MTTVVAAMLHWRDDHQNPDGSVSIGYTTILGNFNVVLLFILGIVAARGGRFSLPWVILIDRRYLPARRVVRPTIEVFCGRREGPDALPDAPMRFAREAAAFGAITSNELTERERSYLALVETAAR